jgi:rhamnosyl/mannosyltransferase
MRVFLIGKYQPGSEMAGGIESYTQDLISSKNVDFKPIFFGTRELPIKFSLLEAPFSSPRLFWKILSMIKFDIIHINIPNPFAELMLLFYIFFHGKKPKIVATYHADAPHYTFISYLADAVRMIWLLPLLNLCDKIISTSNQYANSSFVLRIFLKKVLIIPLGINVENKPTIRKQSESKTIIFIGRLFRYKGIDILLKSFKNIVDQQNDVELLIVGTGPLKTALINLAKKLGLENHVTFTNRVSDVEKNKLLTESDIFVLPSVNRGEAFGISQLDAMLFEKPVVSTKIKGSGVTFVNKNGETGIVVEPNNQNQLANAIVKLLNDNELRKKMGKNVRRRVLKYFTKNLMIKETLKVYKSLI